MNDAATAAPLTPPSFNHSFVTHDPKTRAYWHYLHPSPRPVFTQTVLGEILELQLHIKQQIANTDPNPAIRYLVLTSATPETFSLGGDLDLFARLIRQRDRIGLESYGRSCIDCVFNNAMNLHHPAMTTISLVQGSAMGGGFEAALSTNYLVAERGATFGLPEIMFNLFPGMGAYSLLARRLDRGRAERMLSSGRHYGAAELYEMGIVDVLAEDGEGVHAVNKFMHRHQRAQHGLQAIRRVRERLAPLSYRELEDVVMIWVESAMKLPERDLRTMEKLVAAQHRLVERHDLAVEDEIAGAPSLVYAGAA